MEANLNVDEKIFIRKGLEKAKIKFEDVQTITRLDGMIVIRLYGNKDICLDTHNKRSIFNQLEKKIAYRLNYMDLANCEDATCGYVIKTKKDYYYNGYGNFVENLRNAKIYVSKNAINAIIRKYCEFEPEAVKVEMKIIGGKVK
ncbi:MAG: hypothetical protein Q4C64_07525 [Erysipelotrichia bacterium]|nr:hypothetical protein [Erysipelotrichia bacterium]